MPLLDLLELRPHTGGVLRVYHDGAGQLVMVVSTGDGVVAVALELEPAQVSELVSVASLWLGLRHVPRATVQPLNSRR